MKTGFTLIELLVVVLIMGILASIALPQYQKSVVKARYIKLMPMVKALKNAEEEYWLMHRDYTYDLRELGFSIKGFEYQGQECDDRRGCQMAMESKDGISLNVGRNVATPVVWGNFGGGGNKIGYLMYLDHMHKNYQNYAGQAYCNCYSNNVNDWRCKFCAQLTGAKGPDNWDGLTRYKFRSLRNVDTDPK